MKNFNLYILRHNSFNPETPLLIPIGSSHQTTISYPQGTYNEKITNKPNSQMQLTFNIATNYNGLHNRNADLMVNGQRLRLVYDNNNATCQDFFITKVAPNVTQNNTILTITAVDWFSYELSHTAMGLNYDTLDNGGIKSIQELSLDILHHSSVTNWQISPSLLGGRLPRFYDAEHKALPMRISFSVSGSNCYNALVEIAKKFDATIVPYYDWGGKGGFIDFINNNDFNSKIYHLSPSININNFGVNQQSNNLATITYVTGGEDAYGNPVTLTPKMPSAFKYWLLEHMCYDDDKKPTCLNHNYPIMMTKKFDEDSNTYSYKKYYNSLYTLSNLNRELNTLNSRYGGLYTKYDSSEIIIFSIEEPEEPNDDLTVYINGEEYTGFSSKIVSYTSVLNKILEIRIPASDIEVGSTTLWAGYSSTPVNSETAVFNVINSVWTSSTESITVNSIWEAQNTMKDMYKLFLNEWDAITAIENSTGLAGFKAADITGSTVNSIYNYCNYIDNNVPSAGNFLYNFDYLLEEHLITPVEYFGLNYVLSHDVRNYNLLISIYGELYYELKYQTNLSLATIKTYLSTFLAEIETHLKNINDTNDDDNPINPSMPTTSNINNIVRSRENDTSLVPISRSNTNEDEQVTIDYYTDTCHNKLLEILSNLLREGLTSQYVRNCVTLYGKDFFRDISTWFEKDSVYDIFKDTTNEYFDYLYEYDILLGRPCTKGVHNFNYEAEIHEHGSALEANKILALASRISKQASYWYDANYTIYKEEPSGIECYYHPNYRTMFLNIIEEFVLNVSSPYYTHISSTTTNFNLVDYYNNLLEENKELWTDIRARYSNFLWETTYNDSTELDSSGLYNAALLSFSKVNKPIYNYTVTSIDASQLIDTGTEDVKVGDRISIHHPAVFAKPNYKQTIITIINNGDDDYLKYRIPQKGAPVSNINFTRYELPETDGSNIEIFDQILGSVYGQQYGSVIKTSGSEHTFIIEWDSELPNYSPSLLNILNYGNTLFFGDYSKAKNIAAYSSTKNYVAGDWFYDDTAVISSGMGYKVYQVVVPIKSGTTLANAKKSAHRVDVYYEATISNLSDNDLYIKDSKLYQKYTTLSVDKDGNPVKDENGKQVYIAAGKEIYSYPVYADFVYDSSELLLTVTGVTQTLRENSTQLQVQDNSLINSLVDKLLYSVRFN